MSNFQPRHDTDPVWLNGVQVNTLTVVNAGVGVFIDGIQGWDDSVEVRDVREAKPGQSGEDADNAYMGGRTITLTGLVAGSSWVNLQSRKRTLAATFAPTSAEVLFKVPDPATAAPTTVYATTGMTGYERASVKVVDGIAWGAVDGFTQEFQVSLRASDPRIYSDTESTGTSNPNQVAAGTVDSPLKIEVTLASGSYTELYDTQTSPDTQVAVLKDATALTADVASFTTAHKLVIDSAERAAYFTVPQNSARKVFGGTWVYRMNEAAGPTVDNYEGTAAYDLTATGSPTFNQTGPMTDTKAISFDGVDDRLTVGYSSAMWPSTEWTLDGWFYKSSSGGSTLFDATNGATQGIGVSAFGVTTAALLTVTLYGAGGTSARCRFESSTWQYLAVTYRSGVLSVYLNGVLAATAFGTYTKPTAGTTYFGCSTGAATFWLGLLSSWSMHSTALPARTISDWYNSGSAASICRHKAGLYFDRVNEWPTLAPTSSKNYVGRASTPISATPTIVTTWRPARL